MGREREGEIKSEQNSRRGILRGRAVKRVVAARVGEEPERRLRRARVAEEVGEREGFESERGKEGCARSGVERAMEEEMFTFAYTAHSFQPDFPGAQEPFSKLVRLQGCATGRLVDALVVVLLNWRPTSRRHLLCTRALLHPLPLHALAPSVDSAHTAAHRACDLGAYKAHVKPERLLCACGSEPEICKHFLLHCPLYASPRATLFSTIELKRPESLRSLANLGPFDSLYCPPSEDPPP